MEEVYEVYKEQYKNCLIKIIQDDSSQSPDDWGNEDIFLVAYHRDFEVKRDNVITKDIAIAVRNKEYDGYEESCKDIEKRFYIFGLEAYIHSGISLSLSYEGSYPDRQWDVSQIGLVLVAKKEAKNRQKAKELALNLIKEWNNYLSGNVYGFTTEDEENGIDIDSCWGFYGDYENSDVLNQAKESIDNYIKTSLKESKKKTIDNSKKNLGELLASNNETIRRHAIGILKQLN
jgi:hypothetical protein